MSRSPLPEEPLGWPEDATYDALIGDWCLYQRRRGHKTSTDDVLAAWLAHRCMQGQAPQRYLDLGCGIGSVLLMTCHSLRPAYSLGVEAQHQSAAMAQASVSQLPGDESIEVRHGDFRTALNVEGFDLITGSPPYFPVGTGTLSKDYQRVACRFELRGGVEAYCQAAAKAMRPDAQVVLVFQTEGHERVLEAASAVGLHRHKQVDVRMRVDRPQPFLTVYALRREEGPIERGELAIRDARGSITPAYRAARAEIGLGTRD